MSQIAQQEHLVIDCGESFDNISDEAKAKLRKAYLRGTLLDCVLEAKTESTAAKTMIVGYFKEDDETIIAHYFDTADTGELVTLDCGALQPEDYTDDVPYDGE